MRYFPANQQQQERFFESIFHGIDQAVFVIEVAGDTFRFEGINASYERLAGIAPEDIVGKTPREMVPIFGEAGAQAIEANYRSCVEAGTVIEYEEMLPIRGEETWWLTRLVPIAEGGTTHRIIGSATDITRMKQAIGALDQARREAQAANEAKSAFLANMSHEIRTPMNGIVGFTDLLFTTALSADQREFAEAIQHSASRLLTLINDILDLSKVEAGKLELRADTFDLVQLVDRVLQDLSSLATQKGLQLTYRVAPEVPRMVVADRARLAQVLVNLVGNAIKFTETGEVHVQVDRPDAASEEIRFAVRDTGIGLSDAQQAQLFEVFYQADASATRIHGGSGLGLAISFRLITAMDGRIWCESTLGEGATFFVQVPLRPAVIRRTIVAHPTPDASQANEARAQPVARACILIAEDELVNQKLIARMIGRVGYDADLVATGQEAIEACRTKHYDLVLMDMRMPGMLGTEAAQRIRQELGKAAPPIVAVTAQAMRGDRERFLEAGLDAYLAKPIAQQELLDTISQLLPPANG